MRWMRVVAAAVLLSGWLMLQVLPAPLAAQSCPSRSDVLPEGISSSDWSGIHAVYEASRHAACAVDGGYQARNPGQQWSTHFDGRGFSTRPDADGWTWGLQLERYGFAGQERSVTGPMHVSAAGQRVTYDWDDTLQEWYVNDTRGLEHGYTVHKRPPHDGLRERSPLGLALAIRGELVPQVPADGRSVRFMDAEGATVLTYSGLSVTDADGHELAAHFEPVAEHLLLVIDERGARYPLTIDPVAQQAYLKASNTEKGDSFGRAVAVSGDTVVVGARGEDSSATGVNGNGSINGATDSGAAYVFVRNGTSWTQQAYLKASDTQAFDHFGSSVSVSGDTVVVGALYEDGNGAISSGAAYVFVRSGSSWNQQAYLKASNADANDNFGGSVTVSADIVVVGAPREDSNAKGVNGDEGDNSASKAGAAYVFVRSGENWSQQAYLKASNTEALDEFGISVAVSGDTIVVGADKEDSNATGVDGDQADNGANGSGSAYVFVQSGTSWSQQAYLKASNTGGSFLLGDSFGNALALSDDTVVIGAYLEDGASTGVNGNQNSNSALDAGAAYVFVRSGESWSQQAYLKASNTEMSDAFGSSVAVSGDKVVVGAYREASNATGVNGEQSNNGALESGAAYVFVRSGTNWSQQAFLKASNAASEAEFGISVAVSGTTLVVGAGSEDSDATGVNGDQLDHSATKAGAAYVFDLEADVATWADIGGGTLGAGGPPTLVGSGSLVGGTLASLELTHAPPGARVFVWTSLQSVPVSLFGGTLYANPLVSQYAGTAGASGSLIVRTLWSPGVPPGTEVWFQCLVEDGSVASDITLSNALKATTP